MLFAVHFNCLKNKIGMEQLVKEERARDVGVVKEKEEHFK